MILKCINYVSGRRVNNINCHNLCNGNALK